MFGFATKAEKDAYKAGIRKAEKAAALASSLQADALAVLWARLEADNQTMALARVNDLTVAEAAYRENDNRWQTLADEYKAQIAAFERKLDDSEAVLERADASADRLREKIRTTNEALTGAQRRINELVGDVTRLEKRLDAVADEKLELAEKYNDLSDVAVMRLAQGRELSRNLEAAKKMGEHYRRERDNSEAKLAELINLTPMSTPVYGGNLKDFQAQGRGLRPVPPPVEIKDWSLHGMRDTVGDHGQDKGEAEQSEKVIIDFIRRNMKEIKAVLGVK